MNPFGWRPADRVLGPDIRPETAALTPCLRKSYALGAEKYTVVGKMNGFSSPRKVFAGV